MADSKIENSLQPSGWAKFRVQLRDGIKWWAEHQAWPATEDVRIDRHHRGC